MSKSVFIVGAKRTAFGTFGGALKGMSATDMQVAAAAGALAHAKVDAKNVDSVIVGNVIQSQADAAYLSRHVGLKLGVQINTPCLGINRLCGSGFQTLINGAHEIMLGESQIVLAGGTESMSQCPYAVRNIRFGTKLGQDPVLEDTLWAGLTDSLYSSPMGITAENLAAKYGISREECDAFSLRSQQLWKKASDAGVFKAETAPITLKSRKGPVEFAVDEHPRPQTEMSGLAKLPTVFKKNGTVTAGSSSGICDGAGALVLAGDEAVQKHGLTPLVKIVSYHVEGCEPTEMGIGPVMAIQGALAKSGGLSLKDMGIVEVNEAFAAQALSVQKELGIPDDVFNPNGGAIALGHPLGASGSRIMTTLTHEMQRRKIKYAVGSACIGGGQGIAIVLENCNV
eukprot:Nk52_evm9s235 gene=Nk52_evmTU9s235